MKYIMKHLVLLGLSFNFGSLLAQTPLQVYQDSAAINNPGIQALYKQYEVVNDARRRGYVRGCPAPHC